MSTAQPRHCLANINAGVIGSERARLGAFDAFWAMASTVIGVV
jgi:hypothetical protein